MKHSEARLRAALRMGVLPHPGGRDVNITEKENIHMCNALYMTRAPRLPGKLHVYQANEGLVLGEG